MQGFRFNIELNTNVITGTISGTIDFISGLIEAGDIILTVIREIDNMLHFKLTLPSPSASDVVTKEVTVTIGGGTPIVVSALADATEVLNDGFLGADNAAVQTKLVQIDDNGNRSPDHVQSFVLTDTIAPPESGDVGIVVISET